MGLTSESEETHDFRQRFSKKVDGNESNDEEVYCGLNGLDERERGDP